MPTRGDYSGDGRIDFAVCRPSDGTWYVKDASTGEERTKSFRVASDIPV